SSSRPPPSIYVEEFLGEKFPKTRTFQPQECRTWRVASGDIARVSFRGRSFSSFARNGITRKHRQAHGRIGERPECSGRGIRIRPHGVIQHQRFPTSRGGSDRARDRLQRTLCVCAEGERAI